MPKLLESIPVEHNGRRVRVLFYDDGSLRFRLYDMTPCVIEEAFLQGNKQDHAMIKVAPKR